MWYSNTSLQNKRVVLTSNTVIEAGALSLARLCHFILLCSFIFTIRLIFICLALPSGWQRTVIILSELGRVIMSIGQEISIMVYSCFYRGIHTWPSPNWRRPKREGQSEERSDTHSGTPSQWETKFEENFYMFLGHNYIAKVVFRITKWSWPWFDRALDRAKLPRPGYRVFSGFLVPEDIEFEKSVGAATLCLKVYDEKQSGYRKHLYTETFERVPASIHGPWILGGSLLAVKSLRLVLGTVLLALLLPSLLAPIIFTFADSHPLAQVYWAVEQGAVVVLKYYDFCGAKVNTRFEEAGLSDRSADQDHREEWIGMAEIQQQRSVSISRPATHHRRTKSV
jgi:hypothetical protein